ncbi:meiosis-specific protein ASY3-like [Neltuma alba]|uniref:meiosis-specific protein ASY3-like n=1 Tax=Neltuma alba TaxID=207710 RepID=UPI0010A4B43E|nr:meiosis-specific protein ASY3-like [Prosopis alba]XP_028786472.1 meiosis-specific protein ASY3-like [Prosopis alba]
MDVEAHRNLHDGEAGDCRSFGSNIYPYSQSRKVSIGVMVNSGATARHEAMTGNEVNMTNMEKVISNVGNFAGEKGKAEGARACPSMKPIGPEEVKFARITKSFCQRTPNSETVLQANQTSNLLVFTRRQDKPDGDDTLIFHRNDLNQKKLDGTTSKRKGRKEGTTGRIENEFTFNTAREVVKSDKTKPEDRRNKTEKRTEDLKMKLWEILGTTSSPKTRRSGSKTSNMDEESVLPRQRFDQEDDKLVKTRQQSDTIETDSENLDHTNKKPVTRSLGRKRASAKLKPPKIAPSPKGKKRQREKDIFSSKEQWTGKQHVDQHGVSRIPSRERDQRQNSHQHCVKENEAEDKVCKETSKAEAQLCDEEASSLGEKMGGFRSLLPDHHKDYPQTRKIIPEEELYQSPITKVTDKLEGLEGSANGNQQEQNSPVAENVADPLDNFPSPTFGLKTPTLSSSPGSTPKTSKQANGVNCSTLMERTFSLGIIRNLRTFQTMERDCDRQSGQKQCANLDELKTSLSKEAAFFVKEKGAQDGLSDSSFEERMFLKKREDIYIHDGLTDRHISDARETSMLHPIKRLRSHEGVKFNRNSPPSLSSKEMGGAAESDSIPEASEQTQDGFARAVELFALELGKLKSKLKSVASKKSSEILISVAEDIQLQLKNVHSQIEEDIEEHANLCESKRKRLETRFEDQQKQLRLIHEKFKEEINLYVQDCRSAIEGLEAERLEIKGALEKQRASHRKLLSQVEKGVEIQLNDAQRKVTAIQESARGKLLQLKHITAMCLKNDILK